MGFRNADVLYAAGGDIWEKYGTFVWRTLPGEEPSHDFSRSGTARFLDRGLRYRSAESEVLRTEWDDGEGQYSIRSERSFTPENNDSVRFDSGSGWTRGGISSESSATSMFRNLPTNGEARSFTGDTVTLSQTGTLEGGDEIVVGIFERSGSYASDAQSEVQLLDVTAASVVCSCIYNWDTDDVASGSAGTQGVITLRDSGPNNGRVVLLWAVASGSAGNNYEFRVRPARTETGGTCVVHYGEHTVHSVLTSPHPYVGSPTTRPNETFTTPNGPPPTKWVGYASLRLGHDASNGVDTAFRVITHGSFDDPRAHLLSQSNGGLVWFVDDGTNTGSSTINLSQSPGDLIEVAMRYDNDAGEFYLAGRVSGGSATDGSVSTPTWASPSEFASTNAIGYGCDADGGTDGGQGVVRVYRHLIVRQSAVDAAVDGSDPDGLLDELAGHTV